MDIELNRIYLGNRLYLSADEYFSQQLIAVACGISVSFF